MNPRLLDLFVPMLYLKLKRYLSLIMGDEGSRELPKLGQFVYLASTGHILTCRPNWSQL